MGGTWKARAPATAKKPAKTGKAAGRGVTVDVVRRLALALPETSERPCYGTPGFYVKKALFARLREDGENLVLKMSFEQRDAMLDSMPDIFHLTPHYEGVPMVLVRLEAVKETALRDLLAGAWREAAPARLVAAFDADG